VLATTAASADVTTAPVRPFILPDLSGLTMIGVDLQLTRWQVPALAVPPPGVVDVDQTNLTFDVLAELSIAPHWVLLGRLPLAYHSVEDDEDIVGDPDCCGAAIGNATLGVRVLDSSAQRSTRSVIGGELTVSLPTAPDSDEGGFTAASAALAHLPHDPGRYLPDTTTIRFAGGGQLYADKFFIQGGGGLDIFVFDDDAFGDDDTDLALRLGGAAGFRATHELAILAEMNGIILLDNDDDENDAFSSIDVGIRYGTDSLLLGLRAYIPLDDELRDVDMFGVGLDLGVRI
jgi:hypothetical protein